MKKSYNKKITYITKNVTQKQIKKFITKIL